jgi:rhamnulokinase
VGGGTQNHLLSQFAADATHRRVITGPVEATATGNLLMQALAMGEIASLEQGRDLVRRSFSVETFTPNDDDGWHEAYARLLELLSVKVS